MQVHIAVFNATNTTTVVYAPDRCSLSAGTYTVQAGDCIALIANDVTLTSPIVAAQHGLRLIRQGDDLIAISDLQGGHRVELRGFYRHPTASLVGQTWDLLAVTVSPSGATAALPEGGGSACAVAGSLLSKVPCLSRSLGLAARALRLALTLVLVINPFAHGVAQAQGLLVIEALGERYSEAKPVAAGMSRLIFYRPVDDGQANAVTVYINGAYHTSLLQGGFSEVCLPAITADIGLRKVEGATSVRNPTSVVRVGAPLGSQQYLRVSDLPGLQKLPVAQAATELSKTRKQLHTLSRVRASVPCEDAPVVTPGPIVLAPVAPLPIPQPPQVISLAADALFPFGKSRLPDMLQDGRSALDAVLDRVKSEYASVALIRVIGHSDPIGSVSGKQAISSARAQTVRDYLTANGIRTERIVSEGRADTELAVSGCGRQATPDNILCNRPNRRVSIEISGVRR